MAPAPGMVGVEVGAVVGVAALDTIGTVAGGSVDEALTTGSADVVLTAGSADGALRTVRLEASMVAQAAFTEAVFMAEAVDSTVEAEVDSTVEAEVDSTAAVEVDFTVAAVEDFTAAVADTGNR